MPFPILPVLAGLASAGGIGATAYNVGTNIKDRKARKKAIAEQQKTNRQSQAGFTPSARQGSFFGGTPAGVETFNQYTPEQQAAFSKILQSGLSSLGQNQFNFAPIEAQARKNYTEKTLPSIAERFAGSNSLRSSAFRNQLAQSGSDLESNLAAMKSNYNLQQQSQLQNLLGLGLSPQFESLYSNGSPGFKQALLESLLSGNGGTNIADLFKSGASGIGQLYNLLNQRQQNQQLPTASQLNPMQNPISSTGMDYNHMPQDYTYNPNQPAQFQELNNIGAMKQLYGL